MKQIIISVLVLSNLVALGQTAPSGAGGPSSAGAWSRGGNTQGNNANIMATTWNSPIYWYTDGYAGGTAYQANRARMKLNGTFGFGSQYPINGFDWNQDVNTSGYFLIGNNNNSITDNALLFNQKGAFSLLHLNGATASNGYQEFGYRPWMKTGITLTGNRDLSYFGLRQLGTGEDVTETAIVWSDNAGNEFPGPDDMVFRFTSGGGGNLDLFAENRHHQKLIFKANNINQIEVRSQHCNH